MSAVLSGQLERFLIDTPDARGVIARREQGDETWAAAQGHTDIERREPLDPRVTFRIASVTKTFTAAAALRLWELGLLDLDGCLDRELIGDLAINPDITITQLLQHTCGLRDSPSDRYVERMRLDPHRRWTPREQIADAVASGPPYHAPGGGVHYSNTGFIVASLVIEQASGLSLARAFRELLRFDELGMSATHLETLEPIPPAAGPRMPQFFGSYDTRELDASIDLFGGGGLVSDVRDLCTFWRELFAGQVFDRATTLQRMCTRVPGTDMPGDVGLGIFTRELASGPVWFHTGFWGSIVLHQPSTATTVAAATNQAASHLPADSLWELGSTLVELAL
jgi:D-alanyl-D-alanine carboxypeptidase